MHVWAGERITVGAKLRGKTPGNPIPKITFPNYVCIEWREDYSRCQIERLPRDRNTQRRGIISVF